MVGSATAYYLTSKGTVNVLLLEQVRIEWLREEVVALLPYSFETLHAIFYSWVWLSSELSLWLLVQAFSSSLMLTILEVVLMVDQELLGRHTQSPTSLCK